MSKSNSMPIRVNDCGCRTHDGPHWLHMDYIDYQHNLEIFQRFCDALLHAPDTSNRFDPMHAVKHNWFAWCHVESIRLREVLSNMQREGLQTKPPYSQLSPDEPGKHMWIHGYYELIRGRCERIFREHGIWPTDDPVMTEVLEGITP